MGDDMPILNSSKWPRFAISGPFYLGWHNWTTFLSKALSRANFNEYFIDI
jgi:hypothetical protein